MKTDLKQPTVRGFKSIMLGSWLGWIMDSYDLSMMFLLIVPMSLVFFPPNQQYLAIIETLSIYFVTLVFRPLGGIVFGSLGDRIGRKGTMVVTLAGLGLAVALTGFLPTFAEMGIFAITLLVIMRALTGLFAGGEYGNSVSILMESVHRKRGKIGGILQAGYPIGFTLAALVFLALNLTMPRADFLANGWRIMFYTGIVPALIGLALRLRMPESDAWSQLNNTKKTEKKPVRKLFSNKAYAIEWLSGFLAMAGISWLYSLTLGFYPTILPQFAKIVFPYSTYIVVIAILVSLAGYIISGSLSDRIGRRRALGIFALLGVAFSLPGSFMVFQSGASFGTVVVFASLLAFFTTGVYGVIPSYLSEKFPTAIRSTGVGFSFNSGFIVGSWSSVVVLLFGTILGVSSLFWITAAGIVAGEILIAVSALMSKETLGISMDAEETSGISRSQSSP